jgi:hypothetical protein
MVGMAAVGMALGSTPAWSVPPPQLPQITCVGNGPSTENGDPVTAAATFILDKTVVPTKLTLVLSNTSGVKTPNQGGVLTGVVFNIGNNSVVLNPNQQLVTPMLTAPSFAYDNAGVIASPGLTNRWTSRINPGVYHYGVATTGFGGYFDAAGIGGQSDYGMVAPGTFPTTFPNTPYIQNSLSFMFTTNGDFNVGDIKDVGALFGTQPGSGGPAILSCIQNDFGDAPDPGLGTAPGTSTTPPNYNTRLADGGPSHTLGEEVYLGLVKPDGDDGTLQNSTATDDNNTATNDEDGIDLKNLPTLLTTTTSVKMNVKATNLTSAGGHSRLLDRLQPQRHLRRTHGGRTGHRSGAGRYRGWHDFRSQLQCLRHSPDGWTDGGALPHQHRSGLESRAHARRVGREWRSGRLHGERDLRTLRDFPRSPRFPQLHRFSAACSSPFHRMGR